MKWISLLLLLTLSARADVCTNRPTLEFQYYPAYPDPPTGDVLLVVWRTPIPCDLWRVEVSADMATWIPYGDSYFRQCAVTNGHQTNCAAYVIERVVGPTVPRQRFYRLTLAPGLQECQKPTLFTEVIGSQQELSWQHTPCALWYLEESTNLVQWRTADGWMTYEPDKNIWWNVQPVPEVPTHYRLRQAP